LPRLVDGTIGVAVRAGSGDGDAIQKIAASNIA
jgi:hypothetical protein